MYERIALNLEEKQVMIQLSMNRNGLGQNGSK